MKGRAAHLRDCTIWPNGGNVVAAVIIEVQSWLMALVITVIARRHGLWGHLWAAWVGLRRVIQGLVIWAALVARFGLP